MDRMWGIHPPHPTLYVYNTRTELVDGLQVFSQFTLEEATSFGVRGVPRPKSNVTHIPPDSDWRAVYQQQVMVSMDLFC